MSIRSLLIRSLVAVVAVASISAEAVAATWKIDAAHSSIGFSVRHLMISNVKGTFKDFAGTIDYDGKDVSKASVQVTIRVTSVDTDSAKRDEHLKNADFFDTAKFPEMTFKSAKVEPAGEGKAKIMGDLTLHGMTHPVTIDAESIGIIKDPFGKTRRAGFTGTATIRRKDYGLTWNKAIEAGGVAVGDDVKVSLELEAIEQESK